MRTSCMKSRGHTLEKTRPKSSHPTAVDSRLNLTPFPHNSKTGSNASTACWSTGDRRAVAAINSSPDCRARVVATAVKQHEYGGELWAGIQGI